MYNGDFESGNVGFTSKYKYSPGDLTHLDTYDVLSDPNAANDLFQPCSDHTSGGGNMLAALGGLFSGLSVWCQTVQVEPNTSYIFSAWSTSLTANNYPFRVSLSVNGASPITYLWSTGSTASSVQNLPAGAHSVTVTDANGCQFSGTVDLLDPPLLTLDVDQVVPTGCPDAADGSATVHTGGGIGNIHIAWNNGQTGVVATNLPAGDYTAVATDANGCTATRSVSIQANDQEAPVIQAAPATVSLGPSGSVTLTLLNLAASITDNCGDVSYTIVPPSFDCAQLGLQTVSITAVDHSGNSSTVTIPVGIIDNLPPAMDCPDNIQHCFEDQIVTYFAPVATDNCLGQGGQFGLAAGLPSGAEFPLGTTTNTYTFTDASGNVGACSFQVTILSPLLIQLDGITPAQNQQTNGGIEVTVSGSQSGYTYAWMRDGQTIAQTENLGGAGAGTYTLFVTDAFGCTAQAGPFEVPELVGTGTPHWIDRIGVFPNPTDGVLWLSMLEPVEICVSVFDATGRDVVRQSAIREKNGRIDLSGEAAGLYLVLIRAEGVRRAWRIVLR